MEKDTFRVQASIDVFYSKIETVNGLRGAIKIENRENLGQCPNRGGEVEKKQKCPNFNLGILKTEGGSLFFKNVPISIILQLFCNFAFIKNV